MIDVDIYPEDKYDLRTRADGTLYEPLKTRLPWIPPVGGDIVLTYDDGSAEGDGIVFTTTRVYPHTNEATVQISVETTNFSDDVLDLVFGRDERGEPHAEAESALREIHEALGKATHFGMSEYGVKNLLEVARKGLER